MQSAKGPKRPRRTPWKRVALWGTLAVVIVTVALVGGFYLWFRSQVGAANARVDKGVLEELDRTDAASPESTSTTSAPSSTTTTSMPAVDGVSTSTSGSTTTSAETTSTTLYAAPSGMNILLLGSDTRASNGQGGRSDTIIIVHVDSKRNFVSLLSIPRDLRVEIPGHGIEKINSAYRIGGPALVIRTIRSVFGVKLNHYMEVDFNAFKQITDSLGGVYVDVDRSYDDGKIVFDPGFQLLTGSKALGYVRTRHDNNYDFGRMERQQRFLNAVRDQAMGWNLPLKLPGLIKALFSNIDTDLTANEFLKLAYWGIKLDGSRMRQAKLMGTIQTIAGASYVVATTGAMKSAVKDFQTEPEEVVPEEDLEAPPSATLAAASLSGVTVDVVNATGRPGQGALAAAWLMRQGADVRSVTEAERPAEGDASVTHPSGKADIAAAAAAALGITATRQAAGRYLTVTLGKTYGISGDQIPAATAGTVSSGGVIDAAKWTGLAGKAPFALVAPTFLPAEVDYSFQRSYAIDVDGKGKPATRVGYRFGRDDTYMGISATTWTDCPIAGPGRKVKGPGGVIYRLVGPADKTDRVWWIQDGVLYWVSNTLAYDLEREALLATVMSAVPVSP